MLGLNWKVMSVIGAILLTGASGGTYGYNEWSELRSSVSENTTARLLQTWERLNATRKERRLSQSEWLKWCDAGRRLNIMSQCPGR